MLDAAAAPVGHAIAAPAAASPAEGPGTPLLLACTGNATNPLGNPGRSAGRKSGSHKGGSKARSDDDAGDDAPAGAAAAAAPKGRGGGTAVEFVFEFAGDTGRVRYPAAIVPVLHSGGDRAGWWPVRDLVIDDEAISGRVVLNFANHAHFSIDRRTGTLAVRGLQANATGHCAKVDASQRLF